MFPTPYVKATGTHRATVKDVGWEFWNVPVASRLGQLGWAALDALGAFGSVFSWIQWQRC